MTVIKIMKGAQYHIDNFITTPSHSNYLVLDSKAKDIIMNGDSLVKQYLSYYKNKDDIFAVLDLALRQGNTELFFGIFTMYGYGRVPLSTYNCFIRRLACSAASNNNGFVMIHLLNLLNYDWKWIRYGNEEIITDKVKKSNDIYFNIASYAVKNIDTLNTILDCIDRNWRNIFYYTMCNPVTSIYKNMYVEYSKLAKLATDQNVLEILTSRGAKDWELMKIESTELDVDEKVDSYIYLL